MKTLCNKKNSIIIALFCFLFFQTKQKAYAWKNHSLITEISLKNSNIINEKNLVQAESIEDFLYKTSNLIPDVLSNVENWTISRTQKYNFTYPKTPSELKFNASKEDPQILQKFLYAIRINPTVKLSLFLQLLPADSLGNSDTLLRNNDVIISPILNDVGDYKFIKVSNGQYINPLQVIATASDEPDYGHDINLFADNIKDFIVNFGFGNQPFGNANFSFSSQAPFHMGFYHESPIVYKLAPYIKQTYAEHRIKLYQELSIMAFKSGHPYWGLRFLGWSLHYIQDLTQPFHNAPIPGYSTTDLIGLNILDKLEGAFCKKNNKMNDAINIITNRHLILEKLVYEELVNARINNQYQSLIINFLQNQSHDNSYPIVNENDVRDVISKEASYYTKPTYGSLIFWRVNKDTSAIIRRSFPENYTNDPKYIFNDSFQAIQILEQQTDKIKEKMHDNVNTLMANAGSHTRNTVRSIFERSN